MQLVRPAIAQDPSQFGRRPLHEVASSAGSTRAVSSDLKLFVTAFLAGFVFVSILIA
jgi:hypothetical protein